MKTVVWIEVLLQQMIYSQPANVNPAETICLPL
jgi:hypothetical protein